MLAVGVRRDEHRALGGEESLDDRRGQASPPDAPDDPDLVEPLPQLLGHPPGPVGRVIVHHDDLVTDLPEELDELRHQVG